MREIPYNETDQWIYQREIKPFLPPRLFDAHCHLFQNESHATPDRSD